MNPHVKAERSLTDCNGLFVSNSRNCWKSDENVPFPRPETNLSKPVGSVAADSYRVPPASHSLHPETDCNDSADPGSLVWSDIRCQLEEATDASRSSRQEVDDYCCVIANASYRITTAVFVAWKYPTSDPHIFIHPRCWPIFLHVLLSPVQD